MIREFTDIEPTHFDNEKAKGVAARVVIGKKDGAENFFMRVFVISPGGNTPGHSHDWEHEMFIHSGEGAIYLDGRWAPLRSGSVVFVPGNEEHQIKNTGGEPLTVVCLVPAKAPEL